MKYWLKNIFYSFPVQLLLLHFRKSQVLLVFWLILYLTVTGHFMKLFGANALFLAPEYLGTVNPGGAAIVGFAAGIFIMSWNITTFILHSARFRFLATATNPFLKYCLNNAIIPAVFLLVYYFEAMYFGIEMELLSWSRFLLIAAGFTGGLLLLLVISFAYFFTVDRRIIRTIQPGIIDFHEEGYQPVTEDSFEAYGLPVRTYAASFTRFRAARDVSHYSQSFLDVIFKRHHFSAMVTILLAFFFMVLIAFFMDKVVFQIPACASVFVIFAILIAVMGALSYFLRSWSILFMIGLFVLLNILYQYNIIDPRNKAYGLDYSKKGRPEYSLQTLNSLNTPEKIKADKENMIGILNKWKAKQHEEQPLMIFMNFSGGGLRAAGFSMNVLQHLDSAMNGGLMRQTFLMTGASGGMLAAAYYRQLAYLKEQGQPIDPMDKKYVHQITRDLLNPVFSSWVTRDLIAPAQKFAYSGNHYVKDRAYAFEQKLNRNTGGLLNIPIGYYLAPEANAEIPLMILSNTVTGDLKKMMISTQPISFLMEEEYRDNSSSVSGPDAIDFTALFHDRSPMDLRFLTALRMNATYPYVLPAVWLPTKPVIDVMDAGLRDNYGMESTLRFTHVFRRWINENTSGVLIIQVRSRQKGSWDHKEKGGSIAEIITKPFGMLQSNWFRLQDYYLDDELTYARHFINPPMNRVSFMYVPEKESPGASLNFHLTKNEKKDVKASMGRPNNVEALQQVLVFLDKVHLPWISR